MTGYRPDLGSHTDPRLIVGHCGNPSSDGVLLVAADLATRLGALLYVTHAICMDDYPIDPDAADWEEQAKAAVAEQRRRVEHLLAGTAVRWEYEARRGVPAVVLARVAAEQDALLIVLGGPGKGLAHALRLGGPSVSRGVIGHQPRPVLVVPVPSAHHAA